MAVKNGEKTIFGKSREFVEITLSRTLSAINAFYTEIQDGCQNWQVKNF